MVTIICEIKLRIFDVHSLKEKRSIIKSIIQRVKTRFNVSVIESGYNDKWQVAQIGLSCCFNSSDNIDSYISKVIKFIEYDGRIEVCDIIIDRI